MSKLANDRGKGRNRQLAITQQQLNLLQKSGANSAYGFETMEKLRQLLLGLSLEVAEVFEDKCFKYSLKGIDLCLVNWRVESVQFIVYGSSETDGEPLFLEYDTGAPIDWEIIKDRLSKEIKIKIKSQS